MKLLPLIGYAMLICYLAVPIYSVVWIRRQRRAAADQMWGIIYLCIWAASFTLLVYYILSGRWYGESTPLLQNILETLVLLGIFVGLPTACFVHLRRVTARRHEA